VPDRRCSTVAVREPWSRHELAFLGIAGDCFKRPAPI
jgi:hypothetical protein